MDPIGRYCLLRLEHRWLLRHVGHVEVPPASVHPEVVVHPVWELHKGLVLLLLVVYGLWKRCCFISIAKVDPCLLSKLC